MSLVETAYTRRAEVISSDPVAAVRELAKQLHQDQMAGVIFFCSANYDSQILAAQFRSHFSCPVVGCTTAGEIGSRYQDNGIVAISFGADQFRIHPYLIKSLSDYGLTESQQMAAMIRRDVEFSSGLDKDGMFGLVLMDGLSIKEELVIASINASLQGVSLLGGSAGDSLDFKETRVFAEGKFHKGAGVFVMVESRLPFEVFKFQHFKPSGDDLVITESDPATRRVMEINGGPAASEYAEALGYSAEQLTPQVYAGFPLMIQIGEEWYVRAIQQVNPDGSITFFCAIDNGLPLTIARGGGFVETLAAKIDELTAQFTRVECTIGFDCILRRLELLASGDSLQVEELIRRLNFVGFSTFGEQYGSVHINQTLTGVVLGER